MVVKVEHVKFEFRGLELGRVRIDFGILLGHFSSGDEMQAANNSLVKIYGDHMVAVIPYLEVGVSFLGLAHFRLDLGFCCCGCCCWVVEGC